MFEIFGWNFFWIIVSTVGALFLGGLAFFFIRKLIKKHKAKQASNGGKGAEKSKGKSKDKTKDKSKDAEKDAEKDAKKQAGINRRDPHSQQSTGQEPQKNNQGGKGLPRFDLNDIDIVKNDLESFKRHQALATSNVPLTEDEQKELAKLNNDFMKKYGHIPNTEIYSDYTQKDSGCYCFSGKQSDEFKQYCADHSYDPEKDNGNRMIYQFDIGGNKKLAFCVNPEDPDMLIAASNDIKSTLEKQNIDFDRVKVSAQVYRPKLKPNAEKSDTEFGFMKTSDDGKTFWDFYSKNIVRRINAKRATSTAKPEPQPAPEPQL